MKLVYACVTPHVVVGPGRVCAILDDDQVGWHAGNLDRTHLGLYLTQPKAETPFTDFEYRAAAAVVREWCLKYGLPMQHVTDDQQRGIIASSETWRGKQVGTSDPGPGFDWDRFLQLVRTPVT